MNNKYYITAAIPYVNGKPHIGHALEFVQTDVISLYGADENGLKMVQAAERENLPVQEFCDRNAQKFIEIFKKLNTTLDFFQRASSKIHKKGSQELWKLCEKNGDIYKKKYKGLKICRSPGLKKEPKVGEWQFQTMKNKLSISGLMP